MESEKPETGGEHTCPFCAFWSAYKNSEAAVHVRAIERESLLLARSLLDGCIKTAEDQLAARRAPHDAK